MAAEVTESANEMNGKQLRLTERCALIRQRVFDVAKKGETTTFNNVCSSHDTTDDLRFLDFVLEQCICSSQFTGRAAMVRYCGADSLIFPESGENSVPLFYTSKKTRSSMFGLVRTLAKVLDISWIRVIDRTYYLRNRDGFYQAMKEMIEEECSTYNGTMIILPLAELLGIHCSSYSTNQSDSSTWSSTVGHSFGYSMGTNKSKTKTDGQSSGTGSSQGINFL